MTYRSCPNCNLKNEKDDIFCQECGSPLELSDYIESKKLDKTFTEKVRSFFGNKHIDDLNNEIEEFINLSFDLKDYYEDLSKLTTLNINHENFKEKYSKVSKLDDFRYLDEINEDEDLNKKLLFLKSVKTFINNFDEEIKKLNKLIDDINSKSKDIDIFNNDLKELLNSDDKLDINDKNNLIQVHKSTYDFYDRDKVKNLNIESKNKIHEFLDNYQTISTLFDKHNKEIDIKKHDQIVLNSVEKAEEFVKKINDFKESEEFISSNVVMEIKEEYKQYFNVLKDEDISKLDFPIQSKSDVSKFLKNYPKIKEIIEKINEELSIRILQNKIDSNIETLNQFNTDFNYLLDADFYITFKQKNELIENYQDLFDLVKEANDKIDLSDKFKEFLKTYPDIGLIIETRNEKYVQRELAKHKEFFDNIDGKSLDSNQRLAVVKNELNSQIIAGAGCGKTLTVNAKVRYLIEKKGINPVDILCLSFSNLSVRDLKESLPEGIEVATFHKLGGKILRANNQISRPDGDALDNFIKIYFRDKIINNEKLCKEFFEFYSYYTYENIEEEDVDSIGEVYDIEEARDFTTLREIYGGENEKNTFKNETVKSFEELVISNYLFAHQIDYVYEKVYETDNKNFLQHKMFIFELLFDEFNEIDPSLEIIDVLVKDLCPVFEVEEHVLLDGYKPDFYLVENDTYLEHFGVNRDCQARWLNEEKSKEYSDGIKWKRCLHRTYGSKLIETYSYYMSEDRLLLRLEEKLKKLGIEIKEIDYEYMLSKIVERSDVNKFKDLMKLIKNFIELFKGNDYTIDKFNEFREVNKNNPRIFDRRRSELFLNVVEDIYISYQNYLKEIHKIDFNDMINNATCEVEKGHLNNKYKYILVDEYQDTSYTRYNLVKAIQDKTGAKVCVVGDDWQSIYRFTGCDVSLFTKFEDYFENPDKLRIETTYRNSQELIDISGNFIRKNTNQIDKQLKSKKDSDEKPVKIIYYNKKSLEDKIKAMEYLIEKISKISDEIMILGRNNFDIDTFIDDPQLNENHKIRPFKRTKNGQLIYKKNEELNIEYITVHRSKGLENDNVILINLENSRSGFPNQIEDDPIMDFVINDSDQYEFGEERRLFYVALTRTKNNVYLLVPETDKSSFVIELEENIDDLEILKKDDGLSESLDNPEEFMKDKKLHSIKTPLKCPVCETGDVNLILLNKGSKSLIKFFSCSHEKCEWDGGFYNSDLELLDEIEICPECGGVMQVRNGRYGPFYTCSNRCKTPKLTGKKLERVNKIIHEMEDSIEFETHESHLNCPKCGEGKVILKINPENKNQSFACSNESCDWDGGKTTIDIGDLDKIQICPDCSGILTLKSSRRGKFYGCSNFPKCRFTKDEHDSNSKKEIVKGIKTKLKCPVCSKGDVTLKGKKFVCTKCDWDGGTFSGDMSKIDTLEYCKNPNCTGVTFLREGSFGEFRSCSNYFKTKCKGKGQSQQKTYPKKSKSKWEKFDTELTCPSCNAGDVILLRNKETEKGFFKCTNNDCDWNGGSFNKPVDLLDTLGYCPEEGCEGLTYEIEGKYGPFRVCTYFSKTQCKAGRKK